MSTAIITPNEPVEQVVEPVVAEPVAPVVETPVEAVTPMPEPEPEFVYEYQPKDEFNRPLGSPQVFKGKNAQEVLEKVAKAHQESIKMARELNRKLRLGIIDKEDLPEDAEVYTEGVKFTPQELTAEEKVQLSRDLLDPEKFDQASDRLFEAKMGANPKDIAKELAANRQEVAGLKAQSEAQRFVSANPSYYVCQENFETLTSWMVKEKLSPTYKNFQTAFDKLKAAGLLLEAPIVREEPQQAAPVAQVESPVNTQPEPEPVSRITNNEPQSQPKRVARVASGLTRETASDAGTSNQSTKLTIEEVERMSSEAYKKKILTDPAFAKAVNELYSKK